MNDCDAIARRETAESQGIKALFGEYRSRCLFSKAWILREAALMKIHMMLQSQFQDDIARSLPAFCAVIKVGVDDKMQQVLSTMVGLLDDVLKVARRHASQAVRYAWC